MRTLQFERLTAVQEALLDQVLAAMLAAGDGVPALKFRADNYSAIQTLDVMETAGLLRRENNHYLVPSTVLPLLGSPTAKRVLSDIEQLYGALRSRYRHSQDAQAPIASLAHEAKLTLKEAFVALQLMVDMSLWCAGRTTDLSKDDSFVVPSEAILKYDTFAALAAQVREWGASSRSLPALARVSPFLDHESQRREPAGDVEIELSASQAEAVLAVAEDLAGMEFRLNDYYDDLEPQGVIDSVLSGKVNALCAHCDAIGWRRLAQQLRELTPLRGDAVEAMELVKNFIVPEIRRLAKRKALGTRDQPVNNTMLPAWPAIRACLQEFSFYDIKEMAGLAGLV